MAPNGMNDDIPVVTHFRNFSDIKKDIANCEKNIKRIKNHLSDFNTVSHKTVAINNAMCSMKILPK